MIHNPQGFEFMALTTTIAPSSVRPINGSSSRDCSVFRPSWNLKFSSSCPSRRLLLVRGSASPDGPAQKMGLTNAECEAAVVAGNAPEAPPTRRNPCDPFTCESTPNIYYTLLEIVALLEEVAKARDVGVNSIVLFPKVPDALKSPSGDEAYNDNGLVPRTIRLLKDKYPDLVIYTDVALGPYSSDGHDGIVRGDGIIMNDETVHQLCKQAVSQARAGADVVSPSDMMDGRVGAIRAALDAEGFQHVSIMSYTAKYASSFHGPSEKHWTPIHVSETKKRIR